MKISSVKEDEVQGALHSLSKLSSTVLHEGSAGSFHVYFDSLEGVE